MRKRNSALPKLCPRPEGRGRRLLRCGRGVSLAGATLVALCLTVPAGAQPLQPHQAVYRLSLASTNGGDVVAAEGYASFTLHEACHEWKMQQHLLIQATNRKGTTELLTSDYNMTEARDGRRLLFDVRQFSGEGSGTEHLRGTAMLLSNGSGRAHFSLPVAKDVTLPRGTLFPMQHTITILQAAQEQKRSLSSILFDGTSLSGPQDTYVTIVSWGQKTPSAPDPRLASLPSGRVHIAFFAHNDHVSMLPEYETGVRYFSNGFSDSMDMDLGDFRLRGTLLRYTPILTKPRC